MTTLAAGLVSVSHRVAMCQLATSDSNKIMVDTWEATRPHHTRTRTVLEHVQAEMRGYLQSLSTSAEGSEAASSSGDTSSNPAASGSSQPSAADNAAAEETVSHVAARESDNIYMAIYTYLRQQRSATDGGSEPPSTSSDADAGKVAPSETQGSDGVETLHKKLRVMLVCGSDLLTTFTVPGVWENPGALLRDYGVVCIAREGSDLTSLMETSGNVLNEYKDQIVVVTDPVPNAVSSTKIRAEIAKKRSVKYLLPDPVIDYISDHKLYAAS